MFTSTVHVEMARLRDTDLRRAADHSRLRREARAAARARRAATAQAPPATAPSTAPSAQPAPCG